MILNESKFIKYFSILVLVFISMVSTAGFCQSENVVFNEFLDESGLRVQLLELPLIFVEQFEEEAADFDDETRLRIRETIAQKFSDELIIKDALEFLSNNNNAEYMAAVRDWLNQPLTVKMNELEQDANSPEMEAEREVFLNALQDTPPPQERIDAILEFDEITDATYHTVSIITDLYLALIKTMNTYQPGGQRMSEDESEQIRQSIMTQLLPMYENVTIAMNLFTYRNVPDEELEEYIGFYKTDSGQWFVDISYNVFDFVISRVTDRITSNY